MTIEINWKQKISKYKKNTKLITKKTQNSKNTKFKKHKIQN